jgi:hypothetical protein
MKKGKQAALGALISSTIEDCVWIPIDYPIRDSCTQIIIRRWSWKIDFTDCSVLDGELLIPLKI